MRKILFCTFLVFVMSSSVLYGQDIQLNCPQSLRTARNTYDQGRLHEVPQWLTGCLTKPEDAGGFTDAERIEAYHMLTRTYIYLEEPDKADIEMINLLNTDHFYTIDEDTDPIEFKNLYKKFRTDPVYRVGFKVGVNTNHINVLKNYYFWGDSEGHGTYSSKIGIQVGALFEKDLNKKFVFSPEILYTSFSYEYNNPSLLYADTIYDESAPGEFTLSNTGSAEHIISHQRIQANLLFQYKLDKTYALADKFIPYVSIGPSVSYLMNSKFDAATDVDEQVTGPTLTITDKYKPITFSVIASAGLKVRLGGFYLTADIRYQYGLSNIVNGKKRYEWTLENEDLVDNGYADNDYTLSQTMFNVGLIFPHFHPKKLIK